MWVKQERQLGKLPRYHKLTPKAAEVKVFYMTGTGADCCAISALLLGEARKYYAIRVSPLLSSLSSWLRQFKLGGNAPAMGTRPAGWDFLGKRQIFMIFCLKKSYCFGLI